jgi:iron complex transport system substrate-binding protein
MKKILCSCILFVSILNAYQIESCEKYTKTSQNIIGSSPPINMMIQTLKNYKFPKKISKKSDAFKKLASIEALVQKKIDLVVLWNSKGDYSNLAAKLRKVKIDTCSLDLTNLQSYVQGYKTLGVIMNKQERGNELAKYIQEKLDLLHILAQKNDSPLSIYYAKSENGLLSECDNSIHTEVFSLIGAKNALTCKGLKNLRITISLEKLFLLNPDVILTSKKKFYENVRKKKKYRFLKAVQNEKVFLIPSSPINWIDNPPSFFKVLGAFWLGKQVYPNVFTMDLAKEKRNFFKLFLHRGLNE